MLSLEARTNIKKKKININVFRGKKASVDEDYKANDDVSDDDNDDDDDDVFTETKTKLKRKSSQRHKSSTATPKSRRTPKVSKSSEMAYLGCLYAIIFSSYVSKKKVEVL